MFSRFFVGILLVGTTALYGQNRDPDRNDNEALRRWLQDKRLVTMREIGGDLSLSGEVRTEFQYSSEVKNGDQQRGINGLGTRPMFGWDTEVNLMFDYRTDRTWLAIKLEYDNDMGQRSGTANKIRLEKGYLGGRIVAGDTFIMDAEIGRRYLSNIFDSKIQFVSFFDGLLFRFSKAFLEIGDFYVNSGAFIINDKTNHYGFVTEIGALRIANVGLNLKYSLIDWCKPGAETRKGNTNQQNQLAALKYRYLVSQVTANYQFFPEWLWKKLVRVYGAVATNHLALDNPMKKAGVETEPYGKQNWAWYTGMSMGMIKKQYDWSVDANFQWVQAQAIPSFDAGGIGRGNAASAGLYTAKTDDDITPTTKKTATGNGNFYGFQINGVFALTGNLSVQQDFLFSWTLDKNLGPNIIYKQVETEFVYAF